MHVSITPDLSFIDCRFSTHLALALALALFVAVNITCEELLNISQNTGSCTAMESSVKDMVQFNAPCWGKLNAKENRLFCNSASFY